MGRPTLKSGDTSLRAGPWISYEGESQLSSVSTLCFLTVDMIWPATKALATATSRFPAIDRLCSRSQISPSLSRFSQGGFNAGATKTSTQ